MEELRRISGLQKATDSLLNLFTVYTHEASPDEISSAFADEATVVQPKLRCRGSQPEVSATRACCEGKVVGEVARVHACSNGSAHLCRVVVVRLAGNRCAPFQIFAWRSESR